MRLEWGAEEPITILPMPASRFSRQPQYQQWQELKQEWGRWELR